MSELQEYQDPDDIFRDIDLDDEDAIEEEQQRLRRIRRGFKSAFTSNINGINNLLTASYSANGTANKSQANKEALQRAREKLEVRHKKTSDFN